MRIRSPFAVSFLFLLAIAGYTTLSPQHTSVVLGNKPLHAIIFFILTTCFYWILDTSRRRNINFTLLICTGLLGVGYEFLQSLLPNGHVLDFYYILVNVTSSLAALGLSSWYHVRMLRRKRQAKNYQVVPGDELELEAAIGSGTQDSIEISQAISLPSSDQESSESNN